MSQSVADLEAILALNLTSVVYGSRVFGARMRERRSGTIVNIASVCATHAWPGWSVYAAAKAGVLAFSKGLYVELQPHNVRVTCLTPPPGSTDFMKHAGGKNVPMRLQPQDIGETVAWVCRLPAHVVVEEITVWGIDQVVVPSVGGADVRLERGAGRGGRGVRENGERQAGVLRPGSGPRPGHPRVHGRPSAGVRGHRAFEAPAIPLNSTFRIMKRLTERDYTLQDPATGGYQLSTRVFSLGMSLYTRFELRQSARPHLEWLCRETQETCQIQVARRERMLVLDTVSPEVEFYLRVVPGSLVYYHPNAFGKAILAFLPEGEIKQALPPEAARPDPQHRHAAGGAAGAAAGPPGAPGFPTTTRSTPAVFSASAPPSSTWRARSWPAWGSRPSRACSTWRRRRSFAKLVLECAVAGVEAIGY